MAKAGLRSANRSRTLLGTLTLSGTPHMPITTSHMPSDMADLVPGNSISKRETFFGIRARVGWAWHHVSGHLLLGLTEQQLFVFFLQLFFGLPQVLHVERLFEDWLFLTGSSRARGGGGGDAHEEPDEPTRRCPGCPRPPATTQCPPQDLKILSTCFSPLNISFFNYMPIGLCYIHILWNC